jgi:hypothetical protein
MKTKYGTVRSRPNKKEILFWEERHAKGERQLEGKSTHVHA